VLNFSRFQIIAERHIPAIWHRQPNRGAAIGA
jgi:hypothetical protein